MELYRSASLQSQFRGYDYFNDKKVISFKHIDDSIYSGKIKGNGATYDVTIDIEHPKKNLIVIVCMLKKRKLYVSIW